MARPKNAVPAKKLHVALPGSVGHRLDLLLYSETEQRIPFGAHQQFITRLVAEYFDRDSLPLEVYLPDAPNGAVVYGSRPVIEFLKKALSEQ